MKQDDPLVTVTLFDYLRGQGGTQLGIYRFLTVEDIMPGQYNFHTIIFPYRYHFYTHIGKKDNKKGE